MSERNISEMTLEELNLYQQQLQQKLSEVNLCLRNRLSVARIPPPKTEEKKE